MNLELLDTFGIQKLKQAQVEVGQFKSATAAREGMYTSADIGISGLPTLLMRLLLHLTQITSMMASVLILRIKCLGNISLTLLNITLEWFTSDKFWVVWCISYMDIAKSD